MIYLFLTLAVIGLVVLTQRYVAGSAKTFITVVLVIVWALCMLQTFGMLGGHSRLIVPDALNGK